MKRNYLFCLILLLGVILRFYGLNWGAPSYAFHPDELRLFYAVEEISTKNLNPHFFAYGSLPIYLLKLSQQLTLLFFPSLSPYEAFFLAGRALSALLGSATLLVLYRLGKEFYSWKVGFFAAAFLAVTVLHIQLSHFLTVDGMLTFFVTVAVYFGARLIEQPAQARYYILTGIFTGMALATKFSALSLFGVLVLAHILAFLGPGQTFLFIKKALSLKGLSLLILAFLAAGITALLTQPYALLDYSEFFRQVKEQSDLVRGVIQYPYTLQYEKTVPYFYHLRNLTGYSMGILLGILTLAGVAWMSFVTLKRWVQVFKDNRRVPEFPIQSLLARGYGFKMSEGFPGRDQNSPVYQKINTLILAWTVGYFLLTAGLQVKFIRYLLPIFPFLCLLGAVALAEWESHLKKTGEVPSLTGRRILKNRVAFVLGMGVFLFSAVYAVAFVSIYGKENTRATASKWIYVNIPPGSIILGEDWDLTLPIPIDGLDPRIYQVISLSLYHPDDTRKLEDLSQKLSRATLVALASQRVYGSILRVPDRYPITSKYYKLLFEGKLGFSLVEVVTRYPTLSFQKTGWRITFKDRFADESFSVYDHPKILLFKKTKNLSASEIQTILKEAAPVYDSFALLSRMLTVEKPPLELLFPTGFEDLEENFEELEGTTTTGGGLKPPVTDTGAGSMGLRPTPLETSPRSGSRSDLGRQVENPSQNLFVKPGTPKGEMEVEPLTPFYERYGWILWLVTIELMGLIFLPITVLIFRKLPDGGYPLAKVLGILIPAYLTWFTVSWGIFRYSRILILGTLGLCLVISVYITCLTRDFLHTFFPRRISHFLINEAVFLTAFIGFLIFRAYNPDIFWSESSMDFSFINSVIRSEWFPPQDPWLSGFPLNYYYFGHYLVATLTKLTGIPAQITYNLAFALIPALVISEVFSLLFNLTSKYRYGLLGVLFSCVLGNLDGLVQLYDIYRGKEAVFRFFRSAHEVLPYTVHEFPFWSFIFVDLHAHVLNMPFFLFILLIGLQLLFEEEKIPSWPRLASLQVPLSLLSWMIYALGLGTLSVISSWDYPTAVIFLLFVALYQSRISYLYESFPGKGFFYKLYRFLLKPITGVFGILVPLSLLLYLPFYQNFYRQQMGLGLVGKAVTPLSSFLIFFGLFIFIILSYFLKTGFTLSKDSPRFKKVFYSLLILFLVGFSISLLSDVSYLVTVLLLFLLALVLFIFPRRIQSLSDGFIFLCLMLGLIIPLGCEWIFVRDFLQGEEIWRQTIPFFKSFKMLELTIAEYNGEWRRMNTIFKFYMQAWFLLSLASTYLLYLLFNRSGVLSTSSEFRISPYWLLGLPERPGSGVLARLPFRVIARSLKPVWWAGLFILIGGSLVFTVMGVYGRKYHDNYNRIHLPPTWDGLAYLKVKDPWEYRAIAWLNQQVEGSPVILEAVGDDYLYEFNRISSNTGLPTVLGWPSHAEQREHWGLSGERRQAVQTIYSSSNLEHILRLLLKYDVSYIYIGNTERRTYPKAGLEKFEQAKDLFKEVYRDGPVQIYKVMEYIIPQG
ncbi:MAG TPA: DUF2298 domain-containing protein [Candidatus Limnocylindrales bacterium]|nr:DUF2298 domain-containing protein [Candidatus Limnocylindrales bacterium]